MRLLFLLVSYARRFIIVIADPGKNDVGVVLGSKCACFFFEYGKLCFLVLRFLWKKTKINISLFIFFLLASKNRSPINRFLIGNLSNF
jgi:hypothetical protein